MRTLRPFYAPSVPSIGRSFGISSSSLLRAPNDSEEPAPRKFQGLQAVGTLTPNMPTTAMGSARRKGFSLKEWSEGQLTEVQDSLRELREYDLDDPYNSIMSKEDEAFLESAELHASLKATSAEGILSQLTSSDEDRSAAEPVMSQERREALQRRLMGYRKKLRPNPFGHVKIYRGESGGHEVLPAQLSVDVNPRKMRELLNDYEGKRCHLCNEAYQAWHIHQGFIPHSAREAIVFELLRPFCGTPDEIVKMWWWRLHYSKRFRRIRELSHNDTRQRKKRLMYILKFLRDRQIIRESFNVNQMTGGGLVSSGRTFEFERLEFIGDNVVKYLFNDRFNVIFPVHEGGVKGKAAYCQFMIDGNDGLARAYDYLEFNKLTESDRVISKFKSDVMETVFGELQLYLWSTEVDDGSEQHQLPFTPEFIPLRAIVWHAMEELGHVMLMYHLEYVQGIVNSVVKQNNLNFIRSDPALRTNLEMQREIASSVYSARKMASQKRFITPDKVSFPFHDTALVTGQYHSGLQKQVQQVGGLLPRPFARKDLGASNLFMDHLTSITAASLNGIAEGAVRERERVQVLQMAAEKEREAAALVAAVTATKATDAVLNAPPIALSTASLSRLGEQEISVLKEVTRHLSEIPKGLSPDLKKRSLVTSREYRVLRKGFGSAALTANKLQTLEGLPPLVDGLSHEDTSPLPEMEISSAPQTRDNADGNEDEVVVEYPDINAA